MFLFISSELCPKLLSYVVIISTSHQGIFKRTPKLGISLKFRKIGLKFQSPINL